jgi:hypothetical protein
VEVGSEYGNENWEIRDKPTAVSFSGLTVFLVCWRLNFTELKCCTPVIDIRLDRFSSDMPQKGIPLEMFVS